MKKNKVDTLSEKPTWIVYGTGEKLEDPDFIDYYRLHKLDEVLQYKLLGSFTEEGKYALSPEIKPTLVGIKKLLTATDYGTFVAQSELGCIDLHFKVKFWHVENKGYASLYLVEHVDDDEIVSFVAQYYAEYNDGFSQKTRTAFNILDEVESYEDEQAEKIKQYVEQQDLKKMEREFVVELQSEYYILEMMDVLEKGGEKSKRILAKLKEEHEKAKELPEKNNVYTMLRRKLDLMIMQEGGFNELKKELPQELPKTIQIFTKPVKEYDQISEKLEVLGAPKVQKKDAASSGSAKKKGGKSASSKPPKPRPLYKVKTPKNKSGGSKSKKAKDLMLGAEINKEKPSAGPVFVEPVMVEPLTPAPPIIAEQALTPEATAQAANTNVSAQPTAAAAIRVDEKTLSAETICSPPPRSRRRAADPVIAGEGRASAEGVAYNPTAEAVSGGDRRAASLDIE